MNTPGLPNSHSESSLPSVIQGGMGIYVFPASSVRKVSQLGPIGVASGTGMYLVLPRLLQLGDPGGDYRRALQAFPDQEMARRVLNRYYVPDGIPPTTPFRNIERFSLTPSRELIELTICANFCQIWLAKEGHAGLVGVNFLEKVQMPHLYALYGALLAQVDYLFIGAGIPMQISAVLDKLVRHEPASYAIYVIGADKTVEYKTYFNPREFIRCTLPELPRPRFFPIISSSTIAQMMMKSGQHKIDGWIFESKGAGGHSAPPRGKRVYTPSGEPLYGPKDDFNFAELADTGLPFYCAGGFASPEMLALAKAQGATGIQVSSIFALSNQSYIHPQLRDYIRKEAYNGRLSVFNNPYASPTGFPFKVVQAPNTLGDVNVYTRRQRICDMGGLLQPYLQNDGSIGYRCPAEPISAYCKKGGKKEDTTHKMCLCNGLLSTVGQGQRLKNGLVEPPVVTLGQDLSFLRQVMKNEDDGYSIEQAIQYLLS